MRIGFLFLCVLRIGLAVAQSVGQPFNHLSVEDGLSHNSVNCLLQDRQGFIWLGTNDGLNKYDGYSFTTQPSDPAYRFRDNRIMGLCEDRSRGRIWAATQGGGLHELDPLTGQLTAHPIEGKDAHRWNTQLSVYEDHQGQLWVSTYNGLARYDPHRRHFTLFPSPQAEMPIKTVLEDGRQHLWVGTARGLYHFDRRRGRYTPVAAATPSGAVPVVDALYADARHQLWLGTVGEGLLRVDLTQRTWRAVPYNPGGRIYPYVYLNTLHADAKGLLWLGTTKGLQRINVTTGQVLTYQPDPRLPSGISSANAQAILHDRGGTLWVGTDNGLDQQVPAAKPFHTRQVRPNAGRVNLIENRVNTLVVDRRQRIWLTNQFDLFQLPPRPVPPGRVAAQRWGATPGKPNYLFCLLPKDSSGVWLGTWQGLYAYDQASDRYTAYESRLPAQFVSQGPDGRLWVGGEGSQAAGIASFDTRSHRYTYYLYNPAQAQGLPDKFVYALLASRSGHVWVAINGKGLSRLDPATGRFTHYRAGRRPHQLNSNEVLTFYEDSQGIIWLGTNQGGLNWYDPGRNEFGHLTRADGLPSNRVVGITGDGRGYLWLSTNKGLCRFDPRTKAVTRYDMQDGLLSDDFLENAVFHKSGRLYFGSLNGLVHFDPDSIRPDERPFAVAITGLKVLDTNRPVGRDVLNLSYNENFVSFEFAALTYVLPEQSQYAYQLVGVDPDWVYSGNRRFASYTNLPPGEYTFRVKASNSDQVWNQKGTFLRVIIHPPWWRTWWAYALYSLLFGGAVVGYLRYETNRIRQKQELAFNQQEARRMKAVDELKTRFFANITHEFRTPLSLILSPVETLLQETPPSSSIHQKLALVQRNADQLLRLINQLLDLSKLEAHSMPIALMRGRVGEFVDQLVESFRASADQKGVTLVYRTELPDQEQLFDADKWEKILTNLLANAVKFTPADGRVALTLTSARPAPDGQNAVVIRIADTGIGIPDDRLPYIFDRFYQVDDSRTRAYEGTGIGLALVKELTDLLGGTVVVESRQNAGTTFTLTLPVQTSPGGADIPDVLPETAPDERHRIAAPAVRPEAPVRTVNPSADEQAESPLVLVVEDNAELRAFVANELAASYRVLTAADGEQGWQLTQAELPDIVISDVMMPNRDGYELTQLIKAHPDTDHIAVVLLTAKAALPSRIEGLQQGADEYLSKPFHVGELNLRLRNLLNRQQNLRDQYRWQLTQPDAPAPPEMAGNSFLQRIYEELDANLTESTLSVDWLAKTLAMSRKTLYRKVQSLTNLAPNELIRQYRLRKAADLLRTGLSPTETAYAVGFKTAAHFATVFKDFYGKTPSEFLGS